MTVRIQISVCYNVTPCSSVDVYKGFQGSCSFHLRRDEKYRKKMREVLYLSETSVHVCPNTLFFTTEIHNSLIV